MKSVLDRLKLLFIKAKPFFTKVFNSLRLITQAAFLYVLLIYNWLNDNERVHLILSRLKKYYGRLSAWGSLPVGASAQGQVGNAAESEWLDVKMHNAKEAPSRIEHLNEWLLNRVKLISRMFLLLSIVVLVAYVIRVFNDTRLTISPFSIPDSMTEQGYSGEIVAREILDHIEEIKRVSISNIPKEFRNKKFRNIFQQREHY